MHWSLRMLFAGAGIGILVYMLPILDMLELFLYIVVVPVSLISLVLCGADAGFEGIQIWFQELRQRAEAAKAEYSG